MPAPDGAKTDAPGARTTLGRPLLRASPDARLVVRHWRRLTGGRLLRDADRRTLVACSGGADSTALLLCLAAAAPERVVAAHVRHDMRLEEDALADERSVAELCGRLGVGLVTTPVRVRNAPGNPEAVARRERYAALLGLARAADCRFVAVGHQGDDLLETLVMRLVRGAGPRGLAVMGESRPLGEGVVLIRPMLTLDRERTTALCRSAGLVWREDATNADESRWRARLRARVLPVLRSLRGDVAAGAAGSASLLREAAELGEREAARLIERGATTTDGVVLRRADVDRAGVLVLGEVLRLARRRLGVEAGADRLRWRDVRAIAQGLGDADRRARSWSVGGLRIESDTATVRVARA